MLMRRITLLFLLCASSMLSLAQADSKPRQQRPAADSKQAPPPAKKPVDGHLVPVQTITAPSLMVGLFRIPLRCDGEGNFYLREDAQARSPIHKLNAKGENLAVFDATSNPNFKVDVAGYFAPDPDGGDLYEIVFPHEITRYVFIYKSDGSFKSAIKLQPGFPFNANQLAVFPTGQLLIAGQEYDADRTAAMWPFTGIFAADGRLLKELELEDDKTLHDMAASGDTRVAVPGAPHANRAIGGGQVEVAADGNAYLMRRTNPVIFYAISPGGEVVRRFTIDPGDSRTLPDHMHVYKDRIAVWFWKTPSSDQMMEVVDLEGHHIATYDAPNPDPKATSRSLGAAFACYTENPARFVFLGATDDDRLQLVIAEPR